MLPLFDMMKQAQNGNGLDAITKQFGLAQEQTAKAMAALMPAFSVGLQRNASSPMDFASLMTALSSGNYSKYFENLNEAFTPQGIEDGNSLLARIFGSKDVSRAVTEEAARMTGIGQDVLKQMLPGMANAVMGGLFAQAAQQMQTASQAFAAANPMNGIVAQWMETMGLAEKPKPVGNVLFDNPFAQSAMALFQAPSASASGTAADNPFVHMMQAMMTGAGGAQTTATAPQPGPDAAPAAPANPMGDLVQSMFASGLEVQKNYQKSLESIFETARKA
jgi:hypothetical protein